MKKGNKSNPAPGAETTPVDPKLPVASRILDVPATLSADLSALDNDITDLNRQIEVIKQRKQDIIYGFLGAHNIEKGTPFGIPPTHDKISIFTKEELARAQKAAMEAPPVPPTVEAPPAADTKETKPKKQQKPAETE